MQSPANRWLMLVHALPPTPAYLRVKIGRRLQKLGAVLLKNTVYLLPNSDDAQESFHWLRAEIVSAAGEATILEARCVEGMSDIEIEALFQAARGNDYEALAEEARRSEQQFNRAKERDTGAIESELARLRRKLAEIQAIDFYKPDSREAAEGAIQGVEALIKPKPMKQPASAALSRGDYRGRTWVTRQGVYVDRIASAWLIRRFIDPDAAFRFVPSKGARIAKDDLRFDMFEAEFSHEGDHCTFETLVHRFGLGEPALAAIAEIIHDLDIKDDKFKRDETAGVAATFAGIAARQRKDEDRLAQGFSLLDALHENFRRILT